MYPEFEVENEPSLGNLPARIDTSLAREATSEHPAAIRFVLRNTSETVQEFMFGITPPLSDYIGQQVDGEERLIIIPPDYRSDAVIGVQVDGCWTMAEPPDKLDAGRIVQLDPDATIERTYTVLNHPNNSSCFPTGRYEFSDHVASRDDEETKYEWKFYVDISDPQP